MSLNSQHVISTVADESLCFQGCDITFDMIAKIYQAAVDTAEEGLKELQVDLEFPAELTSAPIRDDPGATTVMQAGNGFLRSLTEKSLKRAFLDVKLHPNGDHLPVDRVGGIGYLRALQTVSDALMVAMFLGGGMSPRASELVDIHYANSFYVDRHLFMEQSDNDGLIIRFFQSYNKVRCPVTRTRFDLTDGCQLDEPCPE